MSANEQTRLRGEEQVRDNRERWARRCQALATRERYGREVGLALLPVPFYRMDRLRAL